MSVEHLDLMFYEDLTEECQKRILKHFNVNSAEEMNWDVFPVTSIPVDKDVEVDFVRKKRRF